MLASPREEITMSYELHRVVMPRRLISLISATMVLGASACTDETPTEPSESRSMARAAAASYIAVDLGTLNGGSFSVATAINPAGKVVGYSEVGAGTSAFRSSGFLWEKGVLIDLGSFGGNVTRALDINPAGQVVGNSSTAQG